MGGEMRRDIREENQTRAETQSGLSDAEVHELWLAHVYHDRHERMNGADIVEIAHLAKGVLELVICVETLGSEALVVAGHRMRCLIVIRPNDRGTWRNGDLFRAIHELGNVHSDARCRDRRGCDNRS